MAATAFSVVAAGHPARQHSLKGQAEEHKETQHKHIAPRTYPAPSILGKRHIGLRVEVADVGIAQGQLTVGYLGRPIAFGHMEGEGLRAKRDVALGRGVEISQRGGRERISADVARHKVIVKPHFARDALGCDAGVVGGLHRVGVETFRQRELRSFDEFQVAHSAHHEADGRNVVGFGRG